MSGRSGDRYFFCSASQNVHESSAQRGGARRAPLFSGRNAPGRESELAPSASKTRACGADRNTEAPRDGADGALLQFDESENVTRFVRHRLENLLEPAAREL